MWYTGQKIVCWNDSFSNVVDDWFNCLPVSGQIYTIRKISTANCYFSRAPGIGFYLEEIHGIEGCTEGYFCATRFTPLTIELERVVEELEEQQLLSYTI